MEEVSLIRNKLERFRDELIIPPISGDNVELTIVVPAYNVQDYLDKCLFSICNHRNIGSMEVIVINDGSNDSTSSIAHKYAKLLKGIVRVIDKENGGHGSTINIGISEAKGRYFRLVDGDDWVDSENLAKQIDRLRNEKADLVLTLATYEYVDKAELENVIEYSMLTEGTLYHFDDLLHKNYGFRKRGPLLSTATYRTDCLKKAKFSISEKKPYVDMEFNAFAQRYVEKATFYDLSIYRYLIGREGQTVSKEFWSKKHKDHRFVILNTLEELERMEDYSDWRRKEYVYRLVLAPMIDSQIFMYDQLCLWSEIDSFLDDLDKHPEALNAGKEYINCVNGASKKILKKYRIAILIGRCKPITGKKSKLVRLAKKLSENPRLKRLAKKFVPSQIISVLKDFLRNR